MKIASFFSGCGGLDLGFSNAGFELVFANDNWDGCKATFEANHNINLLLKSITEVEPNEIPEVIGFVGGPPCQSWSLAGAMRGINDDRGKVFLDYIRLLENKKPLFFLIENVAGIVSKTHLPTFELLLDKFRDVGYNINYKLLNSKNYGVPQERKRVFIVGYRTDLNHSFIFPEPNDSILTLNDTIKDLPDPIPVGNGNGKSNAHNLKIPNHEYMTGSFSTMYMSRNRKKNWDEPSFTIQAGARHAPLHPSANPMIKVGTDEWVFDKDSLDNYRRLSVRECARIQTFPDNFVFKYTNISDGYKMIGNAVPVKLAEIIANKIKNDLNELKIIPSDKQLLLSQLQY
jgi:DNA (cytosine-5)-methyltransferase 1